MSSDKTERQLKRITAERDQLLLDRELNESTRKALKIKNQELLEEIENLENVIKVLETKLAKKA